MVIRKNIYVIYLLIASILANNILLGSTHAHTPSTRNTVSRNTVSHNSHVKKECSKPSKPTHTSTNTPGPASENINPQEPIPTIPVNPHNKNNTHNTPKIEKHESEDNIEDLLTRLIALVWGPGSFKQHRFRRLSILLGSLILATSYIRNAQSKPALLPDMAGKPSSAGQKPDNFDAGWAKKLADMKAQAEAQLEAKRQQKLHDALFAVKACNNIDEISTLIRLNTDVNARDQEGLTLLHHATVNHNIPLINLLLQHKADVNALDSGGMTPLYRANGNPDTIRPLLAANASVFLIDQNGILPLHRAAYAPQSEGVRLLLEANTQHTINHRDLNGDTPLHKAFSYRGSNIQLEDSKKKELYNTVQVLLQHNANPDLTNNQEKKPIDLARNIADSSEIQELLQRHMKSEHVSPL